jgi:hypothetical protein
MTDGLSYSSYQSRLLLGLEYLEPLPLLQHLPLRFLAVRRGRLVVVEVASGQPPALLAPALEGSHRSGELLGVAVLPVSAAVPQLASQSQHFRPQAVYLDLLLPGQPFEGGAFLLKQFGVVEPEAGRVGQAAAGVLLGRGGELDWRAGDVH